VNSSVAADCHNRIASSRGRFLSQRYRLTALRRQQELKFKPAAQRVGQRISELRRTAAIGLRVQDGDELAQGYRR
jgi:hypothetical protein